VKIMSGILLPSDGRVLVDGLVPYRDRKRLARRIGVVFGQRSQLWWDLPLRESFDLIGHLYRIPAADRAVRLGRLCEVLGLGPLLAVPVRSLSLGQNAGRACPTRMRRACWSCGAGECDVDARPAFWRMRAELAAAVLPAPRVLFLDEPTIGLDVEARAAVRDFLRELNAEQGTTVILTTHDLDDIDRLCNRLIVIDHGRIVFDGTIDQLHAAYGSTRMLLVDLADQEDTLVPGPGWAGARVVRAEGHRRWIRFARDQVSAAELVARVLAEHQVLDLSIVEPDIEDVIRRIYRGDAPP
jgi:ABC-2 type transport system ATP-binding protein